MAKNFMDGMKKVSSQLPSSTFSEIERIKKELVVIEELQGFITPLSTEEYQMLETNLLKQGCKDPITVWETTKEIAGIDGSEDKVFVLIDGHNRYKICRHYGIDFKIAILTFDNIEKVKDYMIDFQLGRRNLTPEFMSYFRGLRYNRDKVERGKYDRTANEGDLSKKLAQTYKVSERTIKNDANFAIGLSKLTPKLKQEVLARNVTLNRTTLQELGKKDDIEVGTVDSLETVLVMTSLLVDVNEEATQRKKEISRLALSVSSKADYNLLLQKVKELKKYI